MKIVCYVLLLLLICTAVIVIFMFGNSFTGMFLLIPTAPLFEYVFRKDDRRDGQDGIVGPDCNVRG